MFSARWVVLQEAVSALSVFIVTLLLSPVMVLADAINPSSFTTSLGVGESVTINKAVTVTRGTPTTAKLDVVFVADTTGSMRDQINSAQTGAGNILKTLSSLGNVQFGVASYKDNTSIDPYVSQIEQGLTSNTLAVSNAIGTWSTSPPGSGGDIPEANLVSWSQVANDIAWRADARHFIVTFGDAPGHANNAYPTEAAAIAALSAENIQMEILNTDTGLSNMNSPCNTGDCVGGQADRFAAATGGRVYNNFDPSGTATAITNAITTAFATYNTVSLDPAGNLPGVGVSVSGPITGAFDRSITRTFDYTVTFTGLTAGTHNFSINALVDGGIVATESDRISVGGGPNPVPEPSTLLLFGAGVLGLGVARYRQKI
jgi:hypothetical protein